VEISNVTPAAEVRAAANLIRSHAERATVGPWTAAAVWSANSPATSAVYSEALPPGSEVIGSTRSNAVVGPTKWYGGCWRPQDAEYIALMHPVVAGALAGHLQHLAEVMDYHGATEVQLDGGAPAWVVVNAEGTSHLEWTSALELARAAIRSTPHSVPALTSQEA
jgi:hypothetical protein